jgi:hypothetical protein
MIKIIFHLTKNCKKIARLGIERGISEGLVKTFDVILEFIE